MIKRLTSAYGRFRHLVHELLKFGAVGGFGVVVNVVVLNICLNHLDLAPVRSTIIATAAAIAVNYLGNRFWAYRHRGSEDRRRELLLFLVFSGVGMGLTAGVVAISNYALGFTSVLANNIANYAIGLPIGTLFRFWSYRTWVFTGTHTSAELDREAARLVEEESTPTGR